MAANNILAFAPVDTGTNLDTQAAYLAASDRLNGNQPGTARSKLVNKALRQSSLIAAALAQVAADTQATDVSDTLTVAQMAVVLKETITKAFNTSDQLIATNGWKRLPGGLIFQWGTVTFPNSGGPTSSLTVTFPTAFPNAVLYSTSLIPNSGVNSVGGRIPSVGVLSYTATQMSVIADSLGSANFNQIVTAQFFILGR